MSAKFGNGRSNCRRVVVAPAPTKRALPLVQPVPVALGLLQKNGFATVPPRLVLFAFIAAVREWSVFRYLLGRAFRFRVISMSYALSPTYTASNIQPPQSSR